MVSFTIDADLVKAACECVASKRECIGYRAGLGCICFNGDKVIATDSYILFEGCGATGENLPKWLLLESQAQAYRDMVFHARADAEGHEGSFEAA